MSLVRLLESSTPTSISTTPARSPSPTSNGAASPAETDNRWPLLDRLFFFHVSHNYAGCEIAQNHEQGQADGNAQFVMRNERHRFPPVPHCQKTDAEIPYEARQGNCRSKTQQRNFEYSRRKHKKLEGSWRRQ